MADVDDFMDLGTDLADVPDMRTVPDGEYQLQLSALAKKESNKNRGTYYLGASLDIVGMPDTKTINHVMMLPTEKDSEKQTLLRLGAIKQFYKAFKIPSKGKVEFANYIGNTAWALLSDEESDDPQYGKQNRVRKFNVPA